MVRWFVDRLCQKRLTSVSLRRSLPDAQFVGHTDWEVTGCTNDHRKLEPGQLFVASRDDLPFVREALQRGAAGVVVECYCTEAGRLQAIVRDAEAAYAQICQALAGHPADQLITLGVTGSFGKTITALMIRSIIDSAGERCGLVSEFGFCDGATTRCPGVGFDRRADRALASTMGPVVNTLKRLQHVNARLSVPDAASLGGLLAEMVEGGCQAGVLEVSSDALAHRSFDGIDFHGAVVTDVAGAPWCSHELLIHRRRTKARLFRRVKPGGLVIINGDDQSAQILGGVNLDARPVTFTLGSGRRPRTGADVSARVVRVDHSGTRLQISGFDREVNVHLPLVGMRVASCAVAAATLAWALEIDVAAVVAGLETVESVAGHLERVDQGQDFDVRIDVAQTPQALGEALAALRTICLGRVHCVMSAEGETDPAFRRQLAETAELAADRVILTVSNPRNEDPNQILLDLLAGFRFPGKVRTELDRQTAIEAALSDACGGDVVLIAGKGQNGYDIVADRLVAFHDDTVVRQWLHSRSRPLVQRLA